MVLITRPTSMLWIGGRVQVAFAQHYRHTKSVSQPGMTIYSKRTKQKKHLRTTIVWEIYNKLLIIDCNHSVCVPSCAQHTIVHSMLEAPTHVLS